MRINTGCLIRLVLSSIEVTAYFATYVYVASYKRYVPYRNFVMNLPPYNLWPNILLVHIRKKLLFNGN